MKSTAIAFAIATAALGFGSLAHAGSDGYYRDSREYQHRQYQENWFAQQQAQNYADRHNEQRQRYEQRYQQPQYDSGYDRQYGHQAHQGQWGARVPQYRRGDHLPYQFRQRQYYVNDWRAHRLYAPPQGYQWVQADNGGDYLLVAIATGLIANLLLNQ